MATITKSDGSTETVEITSNTVFSEDKDGNFTMTEGPSFEIEVDIIIGNAPAKIDAVRKPSKVNGTDGDDFIISLFHSEEIVAGEGNDNLIFGGDVIGSFINLGIGDDSLLIDGSLIKSKIDAGDGYDKLIIGGLHTSEFNAGDGDDRLIIDGSLYNSTINTGDGDDSSIIDGSTFNSSIDGHKDLIA